METRGLVAFDTVFFSFFFFFPGSLKETFAAGHMQVEVGRLCSRTMLLF